MEWYQVKFVTWSECVSQVAALSLCCSVWIVFAVSSLSGWYGGMDCVQHIHRASYLGKRAIREGMRLHGADDVA